MKEYGFVEISGPQRSRALRECFEQVATWGLKMPDAEALLLDFGLGEFRRIGEIEFWIANERELGYCGKFLFLFDGQRCPYHYHKVKHETFYVLKGRMEMAVDDRPQVMGPGDVLAMPPGRRHTFIALEPTLILEVSMPSVLRDNFFDDERIGDGGAI